MQNKFAFVGVAGSGKDFFADYLIEEHGFTKLAFADTVKKFTHNLFPTTVKEFYTHEEKDIPLPCGLTPREIWIQISAPILKVDSNFFLNKTRRELETFHGNIIITDVRRKEEFEYLESEGYTVIRILSSKGNVPTNDFDRLIDEFKGDILHTFRNNYEGLEEFKSYINFFMI